GALVRTITVAFVLAGRDGFTVAVASRLAVLVEFVRRSAGVDDGAGLGGGVDALRQQCRPHRFIHHDGADRCRHLLAALPHQRSLLPLLLEHGAFRGQRFTFLLEVVGLRGQVLHTTRRLIHHRCSPSLLLPWITGAAR